MAWVSENFGFFDVADSRDFFTVMRDFSMSFDQKAEMSINKSLIITKNEQKTQNYNQHYHNY